MDTRWPELPYAEWGETCTTLHLWTQIVGKVRMVRTPWLNHSWHVPLYVGARGLTTGLIPGGSRPFEVTFDFVAHELAIQVADGGSRHIPLQPKSVATFYDEFMDSLEFLGVPTDIGILPSEIPDGIPFDEDEEHRSYDADYAHRFWRALLSADELFKAFRTEFLGKCSPVHFFWGSFDLAVTRFSGRAAPQHPAGIPALPDWVAREAYSHEVSSAGFWPGNESHPVPIFYSYAYPSPEGFDAAPVQPATAFWHSDLGEFVLPYADVRKAANPEAVLMGFLRTTYDAAARLGGWDRDALEVGPRWPHESGG